MITNIDAHGEVYPIQTRQNQRKYNSIVEAEVITMLNSVYAIDTKQCKT